MYKTRKIEVLIFQLCQNCMDLSQHKTCVIRIKKIYRYQKNTNTFVMKSIEIYLTLRINIVQLCKKLK